MKRIRRNWRVESVEMTSKKNEREDKIFLQVSFKQTVYMQLFFDVCILAKKSIKSGILQVPKNILCNYEHVHVLISHI